MITEETLAAEPAVHDWWLRSIPAAEQPCAAVPEWAAFVTRALAAAPAAPQPGGELPRGELPGTTGFRIVLAPFAELAGDRLSQRASLAASAAAVDLPAIRARFVEQLADTLARQCARALVLELNVARVTGRLAGDTPSERFRDFLALTACRSGLSALLDQYPVLARLVAQTCVNAADAVAELLARFAADRADLVATLLSGRDPGTLLALRQGAGDGHRNGRSVALLGFADGIQLVYKPRPLGLHRHFDEVVGWFNALPGTPGLRTVALLERPGYGWLEFVPARPCADARQLERFYLRQGAWLALLHALDGTDQHYENLIACADQPVPVDVETLFHPPAPPAEDALGEDPAALVLRSSVLRTGLLPYLLLGDETALDASGLGGDAGAQAPTAGVEWADGGTDRMRLVRRPGGIAGAENRPRLAGAGADADPADHTEALLEGFRTAYRAIAAARAELLGPQGLLHRFADDEVRLVARATQSYVTLLDESTHPDVLRSPAEREGILRLLETDALGAPAWPRLVDAEIDQLWDGDVPLFTARPGSADLCWGADRRIPDALERTGLDRVREKVAAMDEAELGQQEWIIRAAMAARSNAPAHRVAAGPAPATSAPAAPAPAGPGPAQAAPSRIGLLAAARAIGDRLVEQAHRSPGRANWLGLELLADRYWRLGPAGADLGCGYPGPALFLAQLAALTGSARYAETAGQALRPVPRLLERLAADPAELGLVGSGAFAGLGGIAYALAQTAALLDDSEIRSWIEPAVLLTTAAAEREDDEQSGVVDGTAGGLAALLAVGRATGSNAAWRGARLCADRLADRPHADRPFADRPHADGPQTGPDGLRAAGFSAGEAGIGWALLRFAAADGGPAGTGRSDAGAARYERAGLAALRSAVRSAAPSAAEPGWCQGLPGIALAVADSPAAMAEPELAEFVGRAHRALATSRPLPDHSLCHGELGALELLHASSASSLGSPSRPGSPGLQAVRDGRAAALAAALDRSGPRCGTPGGLAVPGLMTGLSGIGHGLLRLGFPERTASALLLQPPIR
ncbi:type 2 lantipeptide synthetase LanM [Streptacidiphilus sp. PB12-B1b]|uniref:type 2 lanthipeptide synthetase LanM family protein n=1 Tax=Streptacidiphilus sp. PB12-B1b TaxID=2705012 RepID=UPI0015FB91D0|nr:type 2 lanthipeptide synthetase LanM family protein [Streptacidiphilus sp. PB12-B1b]QMU78069.1 type 2 lantipeptide synthetase LanM [Streptacidiphilus sp. PB12-B1b]